MKNEETVKRNTEQTGYTSHRECPHTLRDMRGVPHGFRVSQAFTGDPPPGSCGLVTHVLHKRSVRVEERNAHLGGHGTALQDILHDATGVSVIGVAPKVGRPSCCRRGFRVVVARGDSGRSGHTVGVHIVDETDAGVVVWALLVPAVLDYFLVTANKIATAAGQRRVRVKTQLGK